MTFLPWHISNTALMALSLIVAPLSAYNREVFSFLEVQRHIVVR